MASEYREEDELSWKMFMNLQTFSMLAFVFLYAMGQGEELNENLGLVLVRCMCVKFCRACSLLKSQSVRML